MIFFLISALVKSLHHCFQTSNGAESFCSPPFFFPFHEETNPYLSQQAREEDITACIHHQV